MAAQIAHDAQGFLVGELIETNKDALAAQQASLAHLRRIRSDVSAIANAMGISKRAVGVNPGSVKSGTVSPGGVSRGGVSPGVARGRAIVEPTGRMSSAASSVRTTGPQAVILARGRDSGGRFVGTGKSSPVQGAPRGSGGDSGVSGAGLQKLGNIIKGVGDVAGGTDPAIAAAGEIKSVLEPLGRGAFALFGRTDQQKKERWYSKILNALTKRNESRGPASGSAGEDGGGGIWSFLAGVLARSLLPVIASIGAALIAIAPVLGAALGVAVAAAVTLWLGKKAVEALAPTVKEMKSNYDKGRDDVNKPSIVPFGNSMSQVLDESGRNLNDPRRVDRKEAVGTDGRMINDPRRTDLVKNDAPLPPAGSISESLGRGAGYVKNGLEYMGYKPLDDSNDPTSKAYRDRVNAQKVGRVLGVDGTKRTYEGVDGSVESRTGGSLSWRNNNPGNMEYGPFARSKGAIGNDGRFAIFPDLETGRKAKESLIFEGSNYKDLNLKDAISRYAPPSENNTSAYQNSVLSAVGGQNKRMGDYTAAERTSIMDAMQKVEGFKAGTISNLGMNPSSIKASTLPTITAGGINGGNLSGVNIPAMPKIPAMPEISMPVPSALEKDRPVVVIQKELVGQNLSDRSIAHIASGGIGATSGW